MAAYSVADARNNLPKLIDRALGGEEVVITRHGRPVIELRPATSRPTADPTATYEWLRAQRDSRPPSPVSSVDLLNQMYDEDFE